ncbi:MAG TPA: sugar transferase [Candidatus Dormibacteraeota bacterium]|jgi:exopolysaccharide biosynthesis polyprenyl glycosylphosphotransferase|nr:sugar transferase [Candidatus Dormibacteraeota bacterium]
MAASADYEDTQHEVALIAEGRAGAGLDYESTIKRALDVCGALTLLVLASPVCLTIAILVKLTSPGPIVFAQDRVGLNGRRFRFYKFRSMYVDADHRLDELRHRNEMDGPVFKIRKDPRITAVGRFLRRTSLDELPQLVNVLRGEMSLVGPRPAVPREVAVYRPKDMIRLAVKPGLTCLWQVEGRSTVGFEAWMELDRKYVENLSLRLDLAILFRTIGAVVSGRGAY